jgi:SET domain-containing protein
MTLAEARDSPIHGKGVYALCKITKGIRVYEYVGEKITKAEGNRREIEDSKRGLTYLFELDDEFDLDGAVGGNESIYINHSCEPNCEADIIDGRIYIIALRDIMPGEELSYDYQFGYTDDNVPCMCGSPNCRGYILAEDQAQILHASMKAMPQMPELSEPINFLR